MLWDKAVYLGPPDSNWSGQAVECRGLIEHIAEGSYQGTISWQRNPVSDVSSHFVIGLGGFETGEVAQMLDTSLTAWTQGAGNGHWVSVENAGYHTDQLTPQQIEANAQLYAWLMATHGCAATIANNPSEFGLGHHGMGGTAWGNHPNCPGPANVALKPTILARAVEILNGGEIVTIPIDNQWIDAYRMDTLQSGSDVSRGGPNEGEPMWLVQAVKAIGTKLETLEQPHVDVAELVAALTADPEFQAMLKQAAFEGAQQAETR